MPTGRVGGGEGSRLLSVNRVRGHMFPSSIDTIALRYAEMRHQQLAAIGETEPGKGPGR